MLLHGRIRYAKRSKPLTAAHRLHDFTYPRSPAAKLTERRTAVGRGWRKRMGGYCLMRRVWFWKMSSRRGGWRRLHNPVNALNISELRIYKVDPKNTERPIILRGPRPQPSQATLSTIQLCNKIKMQRNLMDLFGVISSVC